MKVKPVTYLYGGMSIELVAETDFEASMLKEAVRIQDFSMSGGKFFIRVTEEKRSLPDPPEDKP